MILFESQLFFVVIIFAARVARIFDGFVVNFPIIPTGMGWAFDIGHPYFIANWFAGWTIFLCRSG